MSGGVRARASLHPIPSLSLSNFHSHLRPRLLQGGQPPLAGRHHAGRRVRQPGPVHAHPGPRQGAGTRQGQDGGDRHGRWARDAPRRARVGDGRVHGRRARDGRRQHSQGHDGEGGVGSPRGRRPAHRGAQADDPGQPGRHAHRPAAVHAQRKGGQARAHGGGGPGRRPAREAARVVRVAGRAPDRVQARHAHARLVTVGLAQQHRASGTQGGNSWRVCPGDAATAGRQDGRPGRRGVADRVDGVDDGEGDAVQRGQGGARLVPAGGLRRRAPDEGGLHGNEGPQVGRRAAVGVGDGGQRGLRHLGGRHRAGREGGAVLGQRARAARAAAGAARAAPPRERTPRVLRAAAADGRPGRRDVAGHRGRHPGGGVRDVGGVRGGRAGAGRRWQERGGRRPRGGGRVRGGPRGGVGRRLRHVHLPHGGGDAGSLPGAGQEPGRPRLLHQPGDELHPGAGLAGDAGKGEG